MVIITTVVSAINESGVTYHSIAKFAVPGDGGWDYVTVDAPTRRVHVSHGTKVDVLDADTGKVLGQVPDTPGVHGIAVASELKRGFTSNGQDGSVTIFDTETLKTLTKVRVKSPDFILYDSFTRRIFPLNKTTTVLDAPTGGEVGKLELQGDPEAAASNGKGKVFVNLVDLNAVAVVDAQTLRVEKTFAIERCQSPHSLVYDHDNDRLFVGCSGLLAVLDGTSGKVVARTLMCSGTDAGAFDPEGKLIFESCAEGVVSVIRQLTADSYELVDSVKTQLWAKTMAIDQKTKNIYLPSAEFELVPNNDPSYPRAFKHKMKPGSFVVLVLGKQ